MGSFFLNSKIANTETNGLSDANFAIVAREEEFICNGKKEYPPTDIASGFGVSNAEAEIDWESVD